MVGQCMIRRVFPYDTEMTSARIRNLAVVFVLLVATGAKAGTDEEEFSEQWKWAVSVLPELSRYRSRRSHPLPLAQAV